MFDLYKDMKMNEDDDKDKMDITNKSIDQLLDDLNNNSSDMNNLVP